MHRKLKIVGRFREKAEEVIHRLLRPYVGRLIERMMAECAEEDEDVPDCAACEHRHVCTDETVRERSQWLH